MEKKRSFFYRYKENEDGVTAIEFSLLAVPFMFTVIAIIEMSVMFTASSLLEGSVMDAARLVKTGQLQLNGDEGSARDALVDAVCAHADYLMHCDQIQYQVIRLNSFSEDSTPQVDEDGNLEEPVFELDQVTAGCIAVVRLTYLYPLYTPLFGQIFSDFPNNSKMLMATATFQVEPYEFDIADGCSA